MTIYFLGGIRLNKASEVTCKEFDLEANEYEGLDLEWIYLLLEAKKMGITPQEIRQFLY